eukprot:c7561_g1_i1.p1 GENE.c7561_g1_i1~~c7561_g1_i1.p1  ORF type:complete len:897 (-),score=252.83 c7561_g1_i1:172-2808(-)
MSSSPPRFTSSPRRRNNAADIDDNDDDDDLDDVLEDDVPVVDDEDNDVGEDLIENQHLDYELHPELDVYDAADIDTEEYANMTADQRKAAEREIAIRERKQKRKRDSALMDSDDEGDDVAPRRRRLAEQTAGVAPGTGADIDDVLFEELDANHGHGNLKQWVQQEGVKKQIRLTFRTFLHDFQDETGSNVYYHRIQRLAAENRVSLDIDYQHLSSRSPAIAVWLADAPNHVLKTLNEEATRCVIELFPYYSNITDEIQVRIAGLPVIDMIRDLRVTHLGCMVRVTGVVTRRTAVFPQLKLVKFDCVKCGHILGPFAQKDSGNLPKVNHCPECQSKGPFSVNTEETIYHNYQKITIQESPQLVPPGRLPRHKDVVIVRDLIDTIRPGEEVDITGIYTNTYDSSLNIQNGFPVFSTVIEANFICKRGDAYSDFALTDDDKNHIRNLAKDPNIAQKIFRSIAPSIYGHEHIKEGIALSLFGGTFKEVKQHRVRGDINVLMLGDPGTAKSQFLRFVSKIAPRAVMATGQGASAVGLTAAVGRDPLTKEFVLEGGALVLADQGVCTIDEFDKMNDHDRTSIHEAMEQQSISISKAGIVTTLQARCSIIAAANPIRGRYDASRPFSQNVDLTEPILSRFDILCVVRDRVDVVQDERLAEHVVASHTRSHPNATPEERKRPMVDEGDGVLDTNILRKYLVYARTHIKPQIGSVNEEKLVRVYAELRKESMVGGGVAVGVRHLESIIRMAEAHARMHLRDHVRDIDLDVAIRVMLESFINAQKFSVMNVMRRKFGRYMTVRQDLNRLLLHLLQGLFREALIYTARGFGNNTNNPNASDGIEVSCDELETKARELGLLDINDFYKSEVFRRHHFELDESRRVILRSS